ncbi:MAG: T9SS type A sorting domain-containing protein [candidate division WOR-3 bacterium]|nr:T9SS type A sorting domain-containing protein [candidate division WOR-3 bacterium]
MDRKKYLLTIVFGVFMPLVLLAQWEPDVRLTNDPSESVTSFNNAWCVACSGDMVHVVWHDDRDGNTEIYYKRSTDNGMIWEADSRITEDAAWSERPSVAVCDSIIHVAWYDGRIGPPRIYYKRSLDNGATWGPDIGLTPTAGVGYHPSVAVCDSIVHVVWTDMRAGPQIYYARSLDNGATWGTDTIITPAAPPAGKNLASVAVSDSIVHVVWMDMRAAPQIYYTRSLDNGTSWETDRPITPATSQFPSVAVSDSIVHVVYADFRFGVDSPKIFHTRSLDDGTNWETEVMLADSFASWYPSVAVSGSHVHVVWPDDRNEDPSEIYYKCSFDDGVNWGVDTRLTDNVSESREPSVAVSGSHVHVVWHDDRDGNWEIYYKCDPTGNVGVIEHGEAVAASHRLFSAPSFFNERITVSFDESVKGPLSIALYDICGASAYSATYTSVPLSVTLGDTRILRLAPGVYFLRIELNEQAETQKLIKFK